MVRLVHIAAGRGVQPAADLVDDAVIDRALRSAAVLPGSPLAGREIGEPAARLTGADPVERRLDLVLRLGPAGDLLGARPGLNFAVLKENPHGIDLGALEPALPGVLLTPDRKVRLAPGKIVADVDRLEQHLDAPRPAYRVISRRQLRSLNSWSHNIGSLAGGSTVCRLRIHPTDAATLGLSDRWPAGRPAAEGRRGAGRRHRRADGRTGTGSAFGCRRVQRGGRRTEPGHNPPGVIKFPKTQIRQKAHHCSAGKST